MAILIMAEPAERYEVQTSFDTAAEEILVDNEATTAVVIKGQWPEISADMER